MNFVQNKYKADYTQKFPIIKEKLDSKEWGICV